MQCTSSVEEGFFYMSWNVRGTKDRETTANMNKHNRSFEVLDGQVTKIKG